VVRTGLICLLAMTPLAGAPARAGAVAPARAAASSDAALTAAASMPTSPADGGSEFTYRVDLTHEAIEVSGYFLLRETKDFAFLHTLGGTPITDLRVQDHLATRAVAATDDPTTWRVDGLEAGLVRVAYRLPVSADCARLPCRDAAGVVLTGGDLVLTPTGVDPVLDSPTRIELLMPPRWSVASLDGALDPVLTYPRLVEARRTPLVLGEQRVTRATGRTQLAIQVSDWNVGAEDIGRMLGLALREQQRMLGARPDEDPALIRVTPSARGGRALPLDNLFLLELDAHADRPRLAGLISAQFETLFRERLRRGMAALTDPTTRWWRDGFSRYTSLLAAVRTGSASEAGFIAALQDAWLSISAASPLRGRVSLADAGALAVEGRPEAAAAATLLRDGGFLACFLLDLRIRAGSRDASTLGDLLAATGDGAVSNERLRGAASKLAGADLSTFFASFVLGTKPLPFPDDVARAGLELVQVGTGDSFLGFTLSRDEPVVAEVFGNGPAKSLGLLPGDRIVGVNGHAVGTVAEAEEALTGHRPGDQVEIGVRGADGALFMARVPVWERVRPLLRRASRAPAAAITLWAGLTRGETSIYSN
jgi:PDZ domain-containing protein